MKLKFEKLENLKELVPEVIYNFVYKNKLENKVKVAEINPDFADGQLLSENYDVPLEIELNCIIVEGKRKDEIIYSAVVVPYGKKLNTGSPMKKLLNVSKISFAPLEYVLNETKMEFGSVTPIGLPTEWYILVDEAVFNQDKVIIGGGYVKSKICVPSDIFKELPNVIISNEISK
ncbi:MULTISPECIES: YbaK/EbsC family protein [Fusobacterium]|uniref:YbaK/EbsC family protein n=1 Tax=Fusobacterium TaxID=848 RepID=UPI00040F9AC0|nr:MULTISPECIES: YbaK/EbsC family protein [Fusobacterium]